MTSPLKPAEPPAEVVPERLPEDELVTLMLGTLDRIHAEFCPGGASCCGQRKSNVAFHLGALLLRARATKWGQR